MEAHKLQKEEKQNMAIYKVLKADLNNEGSYYKQGIRIQN